MFDTPRRLAALALFAVATTAHAQVDLGPYLKKDLYGDIRISPDGAHYAATVSLPDRTVLVVLRRADNVPTAKVTGEKDSDIADFWWVSDTRLVIAPARRFGALERPLATGELHGMDADGGNDRLLVADDPNQGGYRMATVIDTLRDDDEKVLIAVEPLTADPQTYIERLDVGTGARIQVARAPVRRASFTTDPAGEVRFARGYARDNTSRLYYRTRQGEEWRLVNDEAATHRVEQPMGFSADGRIAYLRVEQPVGPDAIVAWDTVADTRTEVMRDAVVDPSGAIRDIDGAMVGARFDADRLEARYFDEASPAAVRQRSLEAAFPGDTVLAVSRTRDGALTLLEVYSDTSPGDVVLYDARARKAALVFRRGEWFTPGRVAPTRAVSFKARDGLVLHGFLTVPRDATGPQPLLVMPHGGPFGVHDGSGFDHETQLLAQAGYAVLRVNYRGSGNYGRAFQVAGAREWGGRMQDDITDATRWAIAEGVADDERICLVGASYGAYAALMGLAREPGLYRCGVGYVGVYDLVAMHNQESSDARWARVWMDAWVGERDMLAARSPTTLAAQVKAPVLLVAGGEDTIAPIRQSKAMQKALEKAGVPVETFYAPREGHGFYADENRREYYVRLLGFLGRHLGGRTAAAP